MKLLIFVLFFSASVLACDMTPLKKEVISQYGQYQAVKNERGEIGHGRGKNFKFSDDLTYMMNDIFLIATFEIDIKWLTGKKQTVRSMVVASVNERTCKIKGYQQRNRLAGN